MPVGESFLPTPMFVALRFHRWQAILAMPAPGKEFALTTVVWHFARGAALAGSGKAADAENERREFQSGLKAIPADVPFGTLNSAKDVLAVASLELDARIAEGKSDQAAAVDLWKQAVAAQDQLNYDEPPDWYYPVRESLGGALLRASQIGRAHV